MSQEQNALKIRKIVDNSTILPGSGKPFVTFYSPAIFGNRVVFYGNNNGYEGIYYASPDSPSLGIVSDNHIPIAELNNQPPTTNQTFNLNAYIAYPTPTGPIAASRTVYPEMQITGEHILFCAANWNTTDHGIFTYTFATKSIFALAASGKGIYNGFCYGAPTLARETDTVYFPGEKYGDDRKLQQAGVYSTPLSRAAGEQEKVFDMLKGNTPAGNPLLDMAVPVVRPLLPQSMLLFHSMVKSEQPALFMAQQPNKVQYFMKPGQVFGEYKIEEDSAHAFIPQLSLNGPLLACVAELQKKDEDSFPFPGLFVSTNGGTPELIFVANGVIPGGGGKFTGNSFDCHTDGTRVAFLVDYEPDTRGGVRSILFVWNARTKVVSKVLDSSYPLDGKPFDTLQMGRACFNNGILTAVVNNGNQYAVYTFDLNDY